MDAKNRHELQIIKRRLDRLEGRLTPGPLTTIIQSLTTANWYKDFIEPGLPVVTTGMNTTDGPWYPSFAGTIDSVRLSLKEVATGTTKVNVYKNGSSIFTLAAHQPTLSAGAKTTLATAIDVPAFDIGDYFEYDITQVGSPPGEGLMITLGGTSAFAQGSSSVVGAVSYSDAVIADSPAAYWPLQEAVGTVAQDLSGNGNNGTYTGSYVLGSDSPFGSDVSAYFTGGYVTVPNAASLAITGDISIECWAKVDSTSGYHPLISKATSNVASPYDSYGDGADIRFWVGDGGTHSSQVFATSVLNSSAFVHIVYTMVSATGATVIYANGSQIATGVQSGAAFSTNNAAKPVLLARRDDGLSGNLRLAHCALYPSVLSAARVLAHYNAGVA